MERLGHSFNLEELHRYLDNVYLECAVAPVMIPRLIDVVEKYAKKRLVICVPPTDDPENDWGNCCCFYFVPDRIGGPRILDAKEGNKYNDFDNYRIVLTRNESLERLRDLCSECAVDKREIKPTRELLEGFLTNTPYGIPSLDEEDFRKLIEEIKPGSFYQLHKILGLENGLGIWNGAGQAQFQKGVPIEEIIAFRDDIFDYVMAGLKEQGYASDVEFAYKIEETVRKGAYEGRIRGTETEERLKRLPLPQWFLPCLSKIKFAHIKSCTAHSLKTAIEFMWFLQNHPEKYKKIVG
jgi:hypothetical protein